MVEQPSGEMISVDDLKNRISHLEYILEVLKTKNSKEILDKVMQSPEKLYQICTPLHDLYWLNIALTDCKNCSEFSTCPYKFSVEVILWEKTLAVLKKETLEKFMTSKIFTKKEREFFRKLFAEEKEYMDKYGVRQVHMGYMGELADGESMCIPQEKIYIVDVIGIAKRVVKREINNLRRKLKALR